MHDAGRSAALQRPRSFPRLPLLLSAAVFLTGFCLTVGAAWQSVNSARKQAAQTIQEVTLSLAEVDSTISAMGWFKPSYTSEPREGSARARQLLESEDESAVRLFARAHSGSWSSRRNLYRQAKSRADMALGLADGAFTQVKSALQSRDEAFRKSELLTSGISSAGAELDKIDGRIKVETPRYPRRYGTQIAQRHKQGSTELAALRAEIPRFTNFLPRTPEATGQGDPLAALVVLNPALALSDSLGRHCSEAIEWLDKVQNRYERAPQQVSQSEASFKEASGGLSNRKARTGYWLKAATALLGEAGSKTGSARTLLTAIAAGERMPDRPEAFLRAEEAQALCAQAIQNADEEIALAEAVLEQKRELEGQISTLTGVARQVEAGLRALRAYHAPSAWSEYSSIGKHVSASRLEEHRTSLGKVARLASLEVQEFAAADKLVRSASSEVVELIGYGRSFIQFSDELEEARADYPEARDRAARIISEEESDVSSYGSHDSGAQSDFEEAVKLLEEAEGRASDRLYVEALQLAQRAASLAEGTGARAKRAYEDDQERASRDDNDGGGFGGSFGGSSGDDGGSSSGSDWGSGSDSDAGSGSDSDWGGDSGSDSDAGGGSDSDY